MKPNSKPKPKPNETQGISLNTIIGETLAELRKNQGLTQTELARIFHMSSSALAHYEQGRSSLTSDNLTKFAEYFKVPTDYILGRCKCKVEFNRLNDKLAGKMTLGEMVNAVSTMPAKQRDYLYQTVLLLKSVDIQKK